MLKQTLTYVDFDDKVQTKSFYFNLTKAELAEMELSTDGGLVEKIKKIIESKDGGEIIATFKKIILAAYGEKSADGQYFIKSPEAAKAFSETQAYSDLFMTLATDAEAGAAFVRGIVPQMSDKPTS